MLKTLEFTKPTVSGIPHNKITQQKKNPSHRKKEQQVKLTLTIQSTIHKIEEKLAELNNKQSKPQNP